MRHRVLGIDGSCIEEWHPFMQPVLAGDSDLYDWSRARGHRRDHHLPKAPVVPLKAVAGESKA